MSFREILSQVKKEIREVTVHDVDAAMKNNDDFVLLDVREKDEWDEGHLPGAVFLPRGFLEVKVEKTIDDKTTPIVVYCAGGTSSAFAATKSTRVRASIIPMKASSMSKVCVIMWTRFAKMLSPPASFAPSSSSPRASLRSDGG